MSTSTGPGPRRSKVNGSSGEVGLLAAYPAVGNIRLNLPVMTTLPAGRLIPQSSSTGASPAAMLLSSASRRSKNRRSGSCCVRESARS